MDLRFYYDDDQPIIACSTSSNLNAAIGIIRLSGFAELRDFQDFFSYSLERVRPRKVVLSDIRDGDEILDSVLLTFFQSPQSYNGENILELSVHGNQLNIQRIINLFVSRGLARAALPGEFTFRALKNKKMSLSQVEGLDLLINASSSYMLSQGQALLHGNLHESYLKLHEAFVKLKAAVELSIDFLEDVGEEKAEDYFQESFEQMDRHLTGLAQRTQGILAPLLTPEIILAGPTNAGKSSLFNFLLKTNRSIVSPQAGTTRDFVSEYLYFHQTHFKLIDTAGLREAQDAIEKEGMNRSEKLLDQAFFKILVVNPLETRALDLIPFGRESFDLLVLTHKDSPDFERKKQEFLQEEGLPPFAQKMEVSLAGPIGPAPGKEENQKSGPIGPAEDWQRDIFFWVHQKYLELIKDDPLILERHRTLIQSLSKEWNQWKVLVKSGVHQGDIGVISHELNGMGTLIYQLIGVVTAEEVLSSIFQNFCIGK